MRLLLVEDDRTIGLSLRGRIEGAGHLLDWTAEERQAVQCVSNAGYDAVILDLDLPDVDAIALCAELRQASRALPILVLSTRDRMADCLASFSAGADDVLAKPFDVDELMARLTAIQRRKAPDPVASLAQPTQIIVVDREGQGARRTSHVVGLTGREFQFFDVLLKQKTKGVSLAAAFRRAFGLDLDVLRGCLDVPKTKLGIHERLASMKDISRWIVLAGSRRRRASLTQPARKVPRPS